MTLFAFGLCLFFATHLSSATVYPRQWLVARLGEQRHRGLFALLTFCGVVFIIVGWPQAVITPLFPPFLLARKVSPLVVGVALVLIVAAQLPCYLRRALRHPMLLGTLLWSTSHLLGGGNLRQTLLFGGFLVFSLLELLSLWLRGKRAEFSPQLKFDGLALVVGAGVATTLIFLHPWLIGVPAWYW